jgi:hypothetical protein
VPRTRFSGQSGLCGLVRKELLERVDKASLVPSSRSFPVITLGSNDSVSDDIRISHYRNQSTIPLLIGAVTRVCWAAVNLPRPSARLLRNSYRIRANPMQVCYHRAQNILATSDHCQRRLSSRPLWGMLSAASKTVNMKARLSGRVREISLVMSRPLLIFFSSQRSLKVRV